MIGIEYSNVAAALRATDEKVKERTAELSAANNQLENLMRSKDQFVATVSHEVRNPLTVVLGFADELRDALWAQGDMEYGELAELIGDQSREINTITEDLLVAARAEVGTMTIVPELIDLGGEVRTVVRGCVCAKEVRDSISLDIEASPVRADPSRVRQIIRNLLTNAIRYEVNQSPWWCDRGVDNQGSAYATTARVFQKSSGIPFLRHTSRDTQTLPSRARLAWG